MCRGRWSICWGVRMSLSCGADEGKGDEMRRWTDWLVA